MSASTVQSGPTVWRRPLQTVETAAAIRPLGTSLALLLSDVAAILAATLLGITLWHWVNPTVTFAHYFDVWTVLALFLLVYLLLGLYAPFGLNPAEELRRAAQGAAIVCMVLAVGVFLSKEIGAYSRGAFLVSGILSGIFVPSTRALVRHWFASGPWWGVPVLVLGAGETGESVIRNLKAQPALGLKPVACLDDEEEQADCAGVSVVGALSLAPQLASALRIRHAVLAMPGLDRRHLASIVERYGFPFTHLILIPSLFGIPSLWVTTRDIGGVLGLEVRQNLLMPANRLLKRSVDLLVAGLLAILAAPVVLVAGLWIKLTSSGSVFFTQQREGRGGTIIQVTKLRTMHLQAEDLLARHLEACPEARQEWHACFKLRNDPRILPGIGRFLRRSSLDELPQLLSVLKGEMSLVGPRPFPRYHLDRFDPEFRRFRARVRPGLTGLWQVTARSDGDLAVQKAMDSYYIRNWSVWLDLYILARTVSRVLLGKGAY